MRMLRSLVFQVVFLGFSTLLALYSLIPLMRGDRDQVFAINALWSRCINRLLRWIVGIDFRVEGREHIPDGPVLIAAKHQRSEEHTSELQSLMRISYAVFCLKKQNQLRTDTTTPYIHCLYSTD